MHARSFFAKGYVPSRLVRFVPILTQLALSSFRICRVSLTFTSISPTNVELQLNNSTPMCIRFFLQRTFDILFVRASSSSISSSGIKKEKNTTDLLPRVSFPSNRSIRIVHECNSFLIFSYAAVERYMLVSRSGR